MPSESDSRPIDAAAANGVLRLALQQSEPRRLALVLIMVGCGFMINMCRYLLGGKVMQGETLALRMALLGFIAVYALLLLALVRRENRAGRLIPYWLWAVSTIIEAA